MKIPKLMTDLHHFSASIAQDALHWAMLLAPLLVRLFLNELTFFLIRKSNGDSKKPFH